MKIHSFSFLVCNLALLFAGTQGKDLANTLYPSRKPLLVNLIMFWQLNHIFRSTPFFACSYSCHGRRFLSRANPLHWSQHVGLWKRWSYYLRSRRYDCSQNFTCSRAWVSSSRWWRLWLLYCRVRWTQVRLGNGDACLSSPSWRVFSQNCVYVGGVGVCNTPLDLDYVPSREEMWVRCAEPYDDGTEDTGHMSVIPTNSLSSSTKQVRMNGLERQYGFAVFHSSLGNYGYATANNRDVLFKVDLAQREVVSNLTLPEGTNSTYDITYSPVNKHIFVRGRVCCSCGSDETDAPSCGRAPPFPVTVVTGPSA